MCRKEQVMEELPNSMEVVLQSDVSAEQPISAEEELAVRIEQAIWRETGVGVRDLLVEVHRDRVFLLGKCSTFYIKQKAQHAAMSTSGTGQLTNRIEVC
jgi:osmotically-inducible protein OsmY